MNRPENKFRSSKGLERSGKCRFLDILTLRQSRAKREMYFSRYRFLGHLTSLQILTHLDRNLFRVKIFRNLRRDFFIFELLKFLLIVSFRLKFWTLEKYFEIFLEPEIYKFNVRTICLKWLAFVFLFGLRWLDCVGLLITLAINCINASGERLNFKNHSRIEIFIFGKIRKRTFILEKYRDILWRWQ